VNRKVYLWALPLTAGHLDQVISVSDLAFPRIPHRAVQAIRRRRRSQETKPETGEPLAPLGDPGHVLDQLPTSWKSFLALVPVPVFGILVVRRPVRELPSVSL